MKYLNHYTVNTGDMRQSFPSEVHSEMIFTLNRIIKDAEANRYADVLDNTKVEITREDGVYALTLYREHNGELLPIFMSVGCSAPDRTKDIWKSVESTYEKIYNKKVDIIPMYPYIADIILPYAGLFLPAFNWTGDFSRCMGWALLAPKDIM